MPLIHGACMPPVCFTVQFQVAGCREEIYDKKKKVVDGNRTAILRASETLLPEVAKYAAKLVNVSLPCDGCVCHKFPVLGPLPVPPEDVGDPQERWQPRIAGATHTIQWGICMPPPAGGGGGGGGAGKGGGKGPGKKGGGTKRRRRAPRARRRG